ncbi:aromatic ring-hydroxylating dioxygenase subunit alpha [Pseudomonas sp. MM227]|uniref:aromatic ring-hydroxylating oxygenase subunit alpha n=1 Tax=Pseudomonas sp. MM227 TaxID=3019968 RepID=UPI00221FDB3E|nr:aromatic ring-hydroxylating dioxygenase subunit alpha [Pseudomonas sp. MM227]
MNDSLPRPATMPLDSGDFHPDAGRSHNLPGAFYFDPNHYGQELQQIFYRTWQYACHVSRLAVEGAYLVCEIGEQSVLVLHGQDGQLRAFHNVCQHRAHRLLEGCGQLRGAITCPYHAWRYDHAGRLQSARHSCDVAGFEPARAHLAGVRLEVMCGLVFVNLDAHAPPLASQLAGLEAQLRSFAPAPESLHHSYSHTYALRANWKVSVENYSECYHCPGCHPSLSHQTLDLSSYRIDIHPGFHAHLSNDQGARQGYATNPDAPRSGEFGAWYVWPNLCIEVYPGGYMNLLHHVPTGAQRCEQRVQWFTQSPHPDPLEQAVINFVAVVREEDLPLCESVQKGLHSYGYSGGRLVVDTARSGFSEHAVHDIQKRVLEALAGHGARDG